MEDDNNTQQSIAEKWDEQKPERKLEKSIVWIPYATGVIFSVFQLVALSLLTLDPWKLRSAHLLFAFLLTFILFKGGVKAREEKISLTDIVLIIGSLIPVLYIWIDYDDLLYRVGVEPNLVDLILSCLLFVLVLEAGRRIQGLVLPVICIIMLLYALFGGYIPGLFGHRGISFPIAISYLFGQEGIFGQPLAASSTYIILFVLFGTFLQNSGVGQFFVDFAYALTGWMRGGAAKVSVVSSALFGTISGSAVANVVVDGVFTIPLMKRQGYKPHFAGAVEAAASTGGQIMPPVMGAVAFVMSDMAGIPYLDICKMAALPAIFYYLSVYLQIDLNAQNLGLMGVPRNELPSLGRVMRRSGHLFIPLVVLIYFLVIAGTSPIRAAIYSIFSAIAVSWISRLTRMNVKKILDSLYGGAKAILPVAIPCAEAGIIVGVFNVTGLGLKMSNILIAYSGGNLPAALILTALICIILGIGLPTVPSYIICAVATVPALIKLGVPEGAAHLFVLYFACFSTITPPVGNAYYAAAAIAKSEPQLTGFTACRLGIVAFIVPFMFVYHPAIMFQGTISEILWAIFLSTICVFALAKGFEDKRYTLWERAIFLLLVPIMGSPYMILNYLGIGLFFLLIIRKRLSKT